MGLSPYAKHVIYLGDERHLRGIMLETTDIIIYLPDWYENPRASRLKMDMEYLEYLRDHPLK